MMPPICCICDQDFPLKEGGLIYFKEDENDKKFNDRLKQPGFVGHPSNAFWFCGEHYQIAKRYSTLTKKEAFIHINEDIENQINNNNSPDPDELYDSEK